MIPVQVSILRQSVKKLVVPSQPEQYRRVSRAGIHPRRRGNDQEFCETSFESQHARMELCVLATGFDQLSHPLVEPDRETWFLDLLGM